MRIAVSNLAWNRDEDAEVVAALVAAGVDALEIAPTNLWDKPPAVPPATLAAYRDGARVPIAALQSLLFGRPDLRLFGSSRDATLAHLAVMCGIGAALGAPVLVFGSPANRRRDGLEPREAFSRAVELFGALARRAEELDVCVCVEPLPPSLGTDFVNTSAEAAELVDAVGSPGFGLHLDSSSLHLSGEDPLAAVRPGLRHFHASEVGLGALGTTGVDHERCAEALRRSGYDGVVSVEMLAGGGRSRDRVLAALDYARRVYG